MKDRNIGICRRVAGFALIIFLTSRSFAAGLLFPELFNSLPVQIEIPLLDGVHSSFGTGVYLNESNRIFLVTAAHCIFDTEKTNRNALKNYKAQLSSFRFNSTNKNILALNLDWLQSHHLIKRHATHDVVVIQFGLCTNEHAYVWPEAVTFISFESPLGGFDTQVARVSSKVPNGCETYIFGYPVELLNGHITSEVDFEIPLIRRGIISQKNRITQKLIIDSGVYGGNSGGPVVAVTDQTPNSMSFSVVGIVTQFVPVSTRMFPQEGVTNSVLVNSGYTVAEPIDFALELIRQF